MYICIYAYITFICKIMKIQNILLSANKNGSSNLVLSFHDKDFRGIFLERIWPLSSQFYVKTGRTQDVLSFFLVT